MQLSGRRVLLTQAFTILIASLAIVVATLVVTNRSQTRTNASANYSAAAVNAARIQADVQQIIALGAQDFAKALVASQGATISAVPLPIVIQVRDLLLDAAQRAARIESLVGPEDADGIGQDAASASARFDEFLAAPSPEQFIILSDSIYALEIRAGLVGPRLDASASASLSELRSITETTRWILLGAALASGMTIIVTTILLGQRLTQTSDELRGERDSLVETTRVMDRRNSQFRALYQIVTEVTENLSTRYVVKTAVHEARRLVGADLVMLRLLRGDQLVIMGSECSDDLDIEALQSIALGDGVTGRSAKRGKTVHISSAADEEMAEEEHVDSIQSGIVVPLIVGARVVGTLGCWSKQAEHFSTDDERILEMMASQVATAVAAADTHEASEKNAHLDALTGLSNRRQLAEDSAGYLEEMVSLNEPFSVAMIDIDHFSLFNNDFGHRIGDITLQKVAHVLKSSLREVDRVYRYGGEEFLVAFRAPLPEAMQLSERLRLAVAETPLHGEDLQPIGPVTISIGVSSFPTLGESYEVIAEQADQALLAAKKQGRNRVVMWSEELLEAAA